MPKKYEISKEAQVLLKLLRIALGTEPMASDGRPVEPFPQAIDWREVIRLSYEQKVPALAVDGLKASGYDPREGKSGRQLEELNAVLTPWFEDVKNSEESYAYYLTVLSTLCQIFSANGLKPVILKGYGLSRDYPIPSHRGAGDIDIYLLDEDGNNGVEKGKQIVRDNLGLEVDEEDNEHHSHFVFKGIDVELHNELCGYWLKKELKSAVDAQMCLLLKETEYGQNPYIIPSPTFTVAYLFQHMYSHGCTAFIPFRQLCDLAVFLKKQHQSIRWDTIREVNSMADISTFADVTFIVMQKYFGFSSKEYECTSVSIDNDADNLMVDTCSNKVIKTKLPQVNRFYLKRWHYRFYYNQHWLPMTIKHSGSYILSRLKKLI